MDHATLYECPVCHFKDGHADRDDVPMCPMSDEPMVPVTYVPVGDVAQWLDENYGTPDADRFIAEFGA